MVAQNTIFRGNYHDGRKTYSIALREPWSLPKDEIVLPSPSQLPTAPAAPNLVMLILPPVLMLGGAMLVTFLSPNGNWLLVAPMLIMSLGFPMANVVGQYVQQRKYKQALLKREQEYKQRLAQEKQRLDLFISQQRRTLEEEYPALSKLIPIGTSRGRIRRLWWRRAADPDFLSIRVGVGNQPPSISILMPKNSDPNDPLLQSAADLVSVYQHIPQIPVMVNFALVGSLVLAGKDNKNLYGFAYRIVLDLLIHHSPEDVQIGVLANKIEAVGQWGWLKWAPHTGALYPDRQVRRLAFIEDHVSLYLTELVREFEYRKEKKAGSDEGGKFSAIVVIIDDQGDIRQKPDVAKLAAEGYNVGIHLIFIGEKRTPNTCRARASVDEFGNFHYVEVWNANEGVNQRGQAEFADLSQCDAVARSLAGLEVAGGQFTFALPDSVRLSSILGSDPLNLDVVKQNWSADLPESAQVQFPVGTYISHNGLEPFDIDFRPESKGGKGEYHALMIGTTGSGKSIFLQSLVLATAHRYSPRLINFLFMDFKAGAAELKKIRELPHVVGMVTDLNRELAERALQALENEIGRRQLEFDNKGKITDIWDFNSRFRDQMLPHLLVVIDEFAEGIRILPDLVDRLKDLGRRGRAFGVYFMLANQEVNSAVDSLSANVGWYIVLKVKRYEEMSLVDKHLPIPPGKGRGYIRVKSDIVQFQSAYAGMPVLTGSLDTIEKFEIQKIEPDGELKNLYQHAPRHNSQEKAPQEITELETLISLMGQAARELDLGQGRKIYQDPVKENITLDFVYEDSKLHRSLGPDGWTEKAQAAAPFVIPIGYLDIPEDCLQIPLAIDFKQGDGNLWIVGSAGSGKTEALQTILMSLAYCYRPDEAQFYILDYGANSLRGLEPLPHTGAVIRLNEQERLERLLRYLSEEVQARTQPGAEALSGQPEIFVVINNFAELRTSYPDQADQISALVRTGKGAGIHLIIATNRGTELPSVVSSNIAQRIVLWMGTKDEYQYVLNRIPNPLPKKIQGRGYFMNERLLECQIAHPLLAGERALNLADFIQLARDKWQGPPAHQLPILMTEIPFEDLKASIPSLRTSPDQYIAPIGFSYDTLKPVWSDLREEIANFLVLGPHQSGKTNFLMSFTYAAWLANPDRLDIKVLVLRRSALTTFEAFPCQILSTVESAEAGLQEILEHAGGSEKRHMLVIDDLGGVLERGGERVQEKLNNISKTLQQRDDLYVIAASLREELQPYISAPIVKTLKQGGSGIVFSNDPTDLDWLGVGTSLPMSMRKIRLPAGRGFFVSKRKITLLQTPKIGK